MTSASTPRYEHHTILNLHQKSINWERYKRKIVKEQVSPHFISCGRSYGDGATRGVPSALAARSRARAGTLPAEGTVDAAPKRKPKAPAKTTPTPEEEDGKQDGISNEIRQIFGARQTNHVGTSKQNNFRLTIT